MKFTLGAFAIILNDKQEVLLCHRRDYDLWNLPGGGVENEESPWEAVIREVKEEVGLDVKIVSLTGVYSKPEKNEVVFSFLCEVISGKPTLTDEADQIEYFAMDQWPSNVSQKQKERVKDFLDSNFEDLPLFKTQIGPSSLPH